MSMLVRWRAGACHRVQMRWLAAGVRDSLLFTPGPLTTSSTVKEAMMHDFGSRDRAFICVVGDVRQGILDIACADRHQFTSIITQGSGTYGVESVLTSVVPRQTGKLLIAQNGAYGRRMALIAKMYGIDHVLLEKAENCIYMPEDIDEALHDNPDITTVAMIHSETTSGILNPVESIGRVVHDHSKVFIVDAMSSFGGVHLSMDTIDFMVSSSNKCVQGVPGFSFTVARRSALDASEGNSRTLSLDLHAQNKGLDSNGQFRFTPPTHAIVAFKQALIELKEEGGVEARNTRYRMLQKIAVDGFREMGFEFYVEEAFRSPVITTLLFPNDDKWDFGEFYSGLSRRKMLIYPGVVSAVKSFRIGHIGHLFECDMRSLVENANAVLSEMGFSFRKK